MRVPRVQSPKRRSPMPVVARIAILVGAVALAFAIPFAIIFGVR